jgi:hypothetical protein
MSAENTTNHIERIFIKVLQPFTKNKNTGNIYEIAVLLDLLRKMGLTNDILDEYTSMLENIITYNNKQSDNIRMIINSVRRLTVGKGLVVDGHPIKDIINATQDDKVGTGDVIVVTKTGQHLTISICQGNIKKSGAIDKVLTNPSAKRFKCTDADVARIYRIAQKAVEDYKRYYTDKYGLDESNWPKRIRTDIATNACNAAATIVVERFDTLSTTKKNEIFDDILRIDGNKLPADYLGLIHDKTFIPVYYKFNSVKMRDTWNPRLVVNGIYLEFMNGETKIGQTQVKFNNGIYHNGKTSSLSTSWNAAFDLRDLFTMSKVQVISVPHTE